MLHIYRQITGLERCWPVVIAQKREGVDRFPFEPVYVVGKPPTHFLRRFWFRQLRAMPWQISRMELESLLRILRKTDARLLHIFFGHIAVHLLPLVREMLDAVKRVLVRSESSRRAVVDLGCDENKIDIMRTGIPLDEFPFRERSFPQNGEWRFVQACRLIEKKGLPTSLRAFAGFAARYPGSRLTIAGDGPLLAEVQELARELKINNRVSLTGFISQEKLREIFYASHIFLHPSETGRDGNQEGIPNSMLEAMASGLPVFATQHGGIPEAIENGVSGVLVRERDHEALTRSLLEASQDRHLLSRIARRGAEVVAEKFDRRVQVQTLEELYLEAMAAPSAGT